MFFLKIAIQDKASKGLSPSIITELFEKKKEHQYNPRHNSQFTIPAVNSVKLFNILGISWD